MSFAHAVSISRAREELASELGYPIPEVFASQRTLIAERLGVPESAVPALPTLMLLLDRLANGAVYLCTLIHRPAIGQVMKQTAAQPSLYAAVASAAPASLPAAVRDVETVFWDTLLAYPEGVTMAWWLIENMVMTGVLAEAITPNPASIAGV